VLFAVIPSGTSAPTTIHSTWEGSREARLTDDDSDDMPFASPDGRVRGVGGVRAGIKFGEAVRPVVFAVFSEITRKEIRP